MRLANVSSSIQNFGMERGDEEQCRLILWRSCRDSWIALLYMARGTQHVVEWVVETTPPKPFLLIFLYPNSPCKNQPPLPTATAATTTIMTTIVSTIYHHHHQASSLPSPPLSATTTATATTTIMTAIVINIRHHHIFTTPLPPSLLIHQPFSQVCGRRASFDHE